MQVNHEVLHLLDSLRGEDTVCGVCGSRVQAPNATLFCVCEKKMGIEPSININ
jgi:hypothetical protein